ncbi:MAG: LysR family transcriptional regulator [Candidatus Lokiarchaeota archaeon]|nr:LysR family transcriptional regulator [Candidatus Lokiarchaeota archaeon]
MGKEPKIEELKRKISFGIKFWLRFENKNILGSGWADLLKNIKKNKDGSLTQAAKECNYSYKYAWNILKRIEKRTGKPVVETNRGGVGGGGWIKLNEWGQYLLDVYNRYYKEISKIEHNLEGSMKTN